VQQGGLIRVLSGGRALADPFLDLRKSVSTGSEQGLLGLAFHPGYACNGRFFVNYTDTMGDTVIEEYAVSSADPNRAEPSPMARLLHIRQPYENHNGGDIVFGPDGFLYIGMGDGGSAGDPQGNGQRLDTLLGKMLRIDVDNSTAQAPYAVPSGNCTGCPAGALPEIYAYGLRNPWRYTFDRATGDLWIGDVGQDMLEEIDHATSTNGSGANFGWNRMEGLSCYQPRTACDRTGLTLPVAQYDHASGDCSVTGGYVYRGAAIGQLAGWYLFSDYCSGTIRALSTGPGAKASVILTGAGNVSTFGEDDAGELYVADLNRGTISQIVAGP
jgi:glucose/arabinose dehydrogenase